MYVPAPAEVLRYRWVLVLFALVAMLCANVAAAEIAHADGGSEQNTSAWGQDASEEDTLPGSPAPIAVPTTGALAGKTVVQVAAGGANWCVVTSDGGVYCWGNNLQGQLGNNGAPTGSQVPVAVDTSGVLLGKRVVQVAVGALHSCALTDDGRVFCWGWNANGQLGNNSSGGSSPVPVAVDTSGALAGRFVVQVAAGGYHSCALTSDGRALCWGFNQQGQLGNGSFDGSNVPVAVSTTGALAGQALSQVAAGDEHSCAVTVVGKVFCWGWNLSGQVGNDSTVDVSAPVAVDTSGVLAGKKITQVSAGSVHTCAVASDRAAYCWGDNYFGELGDNSYNGEPGNYVPLSSGVPVAVYAAGALAGESVVQIDASNGFTCASTTSGAAFCWGDNTYGQLGDNSFVVRRAPVAVDSSGVLAGRKVRQVVGGLNRSAALSDAPTQFVPLAPVRVFDSRSGGANASGVVAGATGVLGDPLEPGLPQLVDVSAIVPPGAKAVSYNVTVTAQTASGFAEVAPAGAATGTSTINWSRPLETIANGHISRLDSQGRLQIAIGGTGTAHVVLDITGAFVAAGTDPNGSVLTPSERRVYDSRVSGGQLAPGSQRTLNINGTSGSTLSGPTPVAAAANVTVTGTTGSGVLSVAKEPTSETSAVNWSGAGQTLANAIITDVAADGAFTVKNNGLTAVDVVVDVTGVFTPGTDGAMFYPLDPVRSYDTRWLGPPIAAGTSRVVTHRVPTSATALAVNTTVTGNEGTGYVSVTYPDTLVPSTSTVNWYRSKSALANGTIVSSRDAATRVYIGGYYSTQYVQDVAGYFQ